VTAKRNTRAITLRCTVIERNNPDQCVGC
jgi:hypothetical protein